MKKSVFSFIFSIFFSIALITFLLYQIDWQKTKLAMSNFNFIIIIPLIFTFIFHFLVRAYRWGYFLPQLENGISNKENYKVMIQALMIGTFSSFILPMRAGEFIRPFFHSQLTKYTFTQSFSSVITERVIDLSTVLFLTLLAGIFLQVDLTKTIDSTGGAGYFSPKLLLVFSCIFIFFLMVFLISFYGELFKKYIRIFLNKLFFLSENIKNKLINISEEVITTFALFKSIKKILLLLFTTFLVWGSAILRTYIGMYGFDNLTPSLESSLVITMCLALAIALPSAPGFFGPYQMGMIVGFSFYNVAESDALAFAIISHLIEYLFVIIIGGYITFINRKHFFISLKSFKEKKI